MNKRLVWNFEINSDNPLQLPSAPTPIIEGLRWEARFFWPENVIITLNGLDDRFLELSRYQSKHRQDSYYLLADANYNVKTRREQVVYKPILQKTALAIAYGKKIKLAEQAADTLLPGCDTLSTQALLTLINEQGRKIDVEKEALIYEFATTPLTKLELARLTAANKTYYSVSIESRVASSVEAIAYHLLNDATSCDYVTFLKTI